MKPNAREMELATKTHLGARDNWTLVIAETLALYREELTSGLRTRRVSTMGGVSITPPVWEYAPNALFIPINQPSLSMAYALAYGLEEANGRILKRSGIECQMINPPVPIGISVWFEKELAK
jgi:hypothetical protein